MLLLIGCPGEERCSVDFGGFESMTCCLSVSGLDLEAYVSQKSRICNVQTCLEWIFRDRVELWASCSNFGSARRFLSAYLIHFQPMKVFFSMDTNELRLVRSARKMLASFDEVVKAVKDRRSFSKVPVELVGRFHADLLQYFEHFSAWRVASGSRVASFQTVVRSSLVSLYMSYFASETHSPSLETTIQELRAKLKSYCGKWALRVFDAELRDGKFGMPPIRGHESLGQLYSDPSFFVLRRSVQIDLLNKLLLDQNFQFTEENKKESPIFVHVSLARARGTHWTEVMFELLSVPPAFNLVHQTLLGFKAKIQFYVRDSRAVWIQEALEFNHISSYGWPECVDALYAVAGVFRKIQMPVRDRDAGWCVLLGGIETPEAMVDTLKFLHRCSMIMDMDFSNMNILTISRQFHYEGVNHMSNKFNELLERGSITMQRTKVVFVLCC